MGRIRVSAIQLLAHDRSSLAGAWPGIASRIREAADGGAQLVVLPEGTLPAYVLGYDRFERSEIEAALSESARLAAELRIVLVVGSARVIDDRVYNSAVVFEADGTQAGFADKYFLWHFDRQWFARGERLQPVATSVGALGVLICADGRIPTIASTLVDRGAELLVMPTAWVTSGRDPQHLENVQADLLARVRARENGVPFVAANKCGVELRSVAYCGKSQIVAADGSLTAIASETEPQILTAEVTAGSARPLRASSERVSAVNARTAVHSVRVAISARSTGGDLRARLRILEADVLIAPQTLARAADWPLPAIVADDALVHDPGALARYRLAGIGVAVWDSGPDDGWQIAFARARALELRIYVVVLDRASGRAYAVDPDGAIVCGTYGDYEIASFSYDAARTLQTLVAPGTDVREGLERVHADAP